MANQTFTEIQSFWPDEIIAAALAFVIEPHRWLLDHCRAGIISARQARRFW